MSGEIALVVGRLGCRVLLHSLCSVWQIFIHLRICSADSWSSTLAGRWDIDGHSEEGVAVRGCWQARFQRYLEGWGAGRTRENIKLDKPHLLALIDADSADKSLAVSFPKDSVQLESVGVLVSGPWPHHAHALEDDPTPPTCVSCRRLDEPGPVFEAGCVLGIFADWQGILVVREESIGRLTLQSSRSQLAEGFY